MPAADFINKMCDERLRFMKSLKGGSMWTKYGTGWGNRVADLRTYSLALAAGKLTGPAPDLSNTPTPKAEVQKPGKTTNTAVTGSGSVIATVLGYLGNVPWGWVAAGVAVIVVIAVTVHIVRDIKAAKEDQVHL